MSDNTIIAENSILNFDKTWTLFLDRDGVINRKLENDYVKSLSELEIIYGVLEAIEQFAQHFGRIIVVTNQQGIGKGLMTEEDLQIIHNHLNEKVVQHNGRIDAFYFAPQLAAEHSEMRKPNIGMALQAKADFPEIDFDKSIMVGDSLSDMEFARSAGMIPIYLTHVQKNSNYYCVPSLFALSEKLNKFI